MGGKDRTCQGGSVPVLLLKADCYNQRPFFVSKVLKSISYLYQQKLMADVYTGTVESVKGFVWQKYVKRHYRKTAGHKKHSFDPFSLKISVSQWRGGLKDIFGAWHFLTAHLKHVCASYKGNKCTYNSKKPSLNIMRTLSTNGFPLFWLISQNGKWISRTFSIKCKNASFKRWWCSLCKSERQFVEHFVIL